ncbi:hypothetical protein A5696_21430 [Mycobacterium sp. E2699]|nr:hypothetical protein A5696_21430 [Mycobacterium sp. E2699]
MIGRVVRLRVVRRGRTDGHPTLIVRTSPRPAMMLRRLSVGMAFRRTEMVHRGATTMVPQTTAPDRIPCTPTSLLVTVGTACRMGHLIRTMGNRCLSIGIFQIIQLTRAR